MANGKYTTQLDSIFALDSLAALQPIDSVRMEWDSLKDDEQAEYGSFDEYKNMNIYCRKRYFSSRF